MDKRDLKRLVPLANHSLLVSANSTQTGAAVDTKGYNGVMVVMRVNTWSVGSFTFEIQHSDASASGFTAVPNAELIGTEPVVDGAADDDQSYIVGYVGQKRFIKVKCTLSSVTPAKLISAMVIGGIPRDHGQTLSN